MLRNKAKQVEETGTENFVPPTLSSFLKGAKPGSDIGGIQALAWDKGLSFEYVGQETLTMANGRSRIKSHVRIWLKRVFMDQGRLLLSPDRVVRF